MKILLIAGGLLLKVSLMAQDVGIGTNTQLSHLHVEQRNVLFNGPSLLPGIPGTLGPCGTGSRLIWYGDKAALRAGFAIGASWNQDSIGQYSMALGYNSRATGSAALAMGSNSKAMGSVSTAFGIGCTASGSGSTAFGRSSIASGEYSTALGNHVSTSGYTGAFALGDYSTTTLMESFVANGFRARFAGGYLLFTNSAVSIGAFLNANANSWAALSDVRMKENFLPVDGEVFLKKIAAMPQVSWNYIGQDAKTLRHYGPMAQDFYAAFGKDAMGEIGCDTLINQQDFLGVNLIAIQALEKRTTEQEKQIRELQKANTTLEMEVKKLIQALQKK